MKIKKGTIKEDVSRDLYLARIVFSSNDDSKKTHVFTCASVEYLEDKFELSGGEQLAEAHLNEWFDEVVEKWTSFEDGILERDVHYDVYANTKEGEANGIDYLINKSQLR